jgi:hypothetical protein
MAQSSTIALACVPGFAARVGGLVGAEGAIARTTLVHPLSLRRDVNERTIMELSTIHAAVAALVSASAALQTASAEGDAIAERDAFKLASEQAKDAALASAEGIAAALGIAAQDKADASASDKGAQRTLWEAMLAMAGFAQGNVTNFDALASQFERNGRAAHLAAVKARTGKEPKNWKTAMNRASDVRILMRAGFDVLEPLPVEALFEDADSDKATEYAVTVPDHGPVTQREAQDAVALMRKREAQAAEAARAALFPVNPLNPDDWTAGNVETLRNAFFSAHEASAATAAELANTRAALRSALEGDGSADAARIVIQSLETRIAERDEIARQRDEYVKRIEAELATARAELATARKVAEAEAAE